MTREDTKAVMRTAQLWVCEEAKVDQRGQGVGVSLGKSGWRHEVKRKDSKVTF